MRNNDASTAVDGIAIGKLTYFQDIKISAGHEFNVTVDTQYAEACDDQNLFIDYVSSLCASCSQERGSHPIFEKANMPTVTSPGRLIYIDDGVPISYYYNGNH
jgi:pyruvate kinase